MVTMLRRALALSALMLAGRAAHAEPGQAELNWTAPAGCPGAEVVRQRVERILNRPLAAAEGERLTVSALVTPASEVQPWSVTLESDDGERRASRTLQAASCDELANATALFLAILIQPDLGDPAPAQESTSAETTAPPPPAASLPTASEAPAVDRGARAADRAANAAASHWAIGGVAGARSGLVPSWTFGLGVHTAFSWKVLRIDAGASYWLPVKETVDAAVTQGAELQLSSAHTELCVRAESALLVPALCSGAELSLLRGRGFGPGVEPESRSAVFASVTAGGALLVRSSERLSLVFDVDALLPVGERQFVLSGSDPAVIHPPSAGFRLTCGAEWSL